jgi:sugar phosphate isomerase/epimerase
MLACAEADYDPVAWIDATSGRIRSIHCKDRSAGPDKATGFRWAEAKGAMVRKKVKT